MMIRLVSANAADSITFQAAQYYIEDDRCRKEEIFSIMNSNVEKKKKKSPDDKSKYNIRRRR